MIRKKFLALNIVIVLGVLPSVKTLSLSETGPRDVLVRFCELDSQGKQLSSDGWQEIASLFTAATEPRWDKIIVFRDYVVSLPALSGPRAEFYVEYINLAQLDPSTARLSLVPPIMVRDGFDLVLGNQHSAIQSAGSVRQANMPEGWRIEGSPPVPHLTVQAAIRFVTELRNKARNNVVKKNADRSLATLNRLGQLKGAPGRHYPKAVSVQEQKTTELRKLR